MSEFKTRQQIADEYGIDRKTFDKKLVIHNIELPPGNISPHNQDTIYERFGPPKNN